MRTKLISKTVVASAVSLAFAAGISMQALAAPPETEPKLDTRFEQIDTNRDGRLSRIETAHIKGFAKAFDEADADKDAHLTPDEFAKAQSIYDRMRLADYASDAAITAKVKTALLAQGELNPLAVSVETKGGLVILSGFVERQADAAKAEKVASSVSGVVSVKNALEVK